MIDFDELNIHDEDSIIPPMEEVLVHNNHHNIDP